MRTALAASKKTPETNRISAGFPAWGGKPDSEAGVTVRPLPEQKKDGARSKLEYKAGFFGLDIDYNHTDDHEDDPSGDEERVEGKKQSIDL